jgi:hypothetical protein
LTSITKYYFFIYIQQHVARYEEKEKKTNECFSFCQIYLYLTSILLLC